MMNDIFERTYYRGTKRVLQFIGQWPFQHSIKNKFLRFITLIIILSIFLPKMIKLLESLDDLNEVLECIPNVSLHIVSLLKFFNWAINEDHMKKLILAIERDWENLKSERDIKILEEYSERGHIINNIYAGALFGILTLFLASPVVPRILDYVHPLNESRPKIFLYETEYFIDQDKYYLYVSIHACLTLPVSNACIIYFDNLFAIFINHTCGMMEILKNHLETLTSDKSSKGSETTFERLKLCLHLQSNIIEFIRKLESSYTIALLLIVGINMIGISLNGYVVVTSFNDSTKLIRFMAFNCGTIFHLFWSSWLGHNLIVKSESVFRSAYQSEWYEAPNDLQRMLLPVMMRSLKPYQITAGSMYVMSMQSFGAAMKTTVSFLTLILSIR